MTPEPNRPDEREAAAGLRPSTRPDMIHAGILASLRGDCNPNGDDYDRRICAALDRAIDLLQAPKASNPWQEAILDALAVSCMDAPASESPRDILRRIISFHEETALDPAVSERAAALLRRDAPREGREAVLPEGTFGWAADRNSVYYTAEQMIAFRAESLAAHRPKPAWEGTIDKVVRDALMRPDGTGILRVSYVDPDSTKASPPPDAPERDAVIDWKWTRGWVDPNKPPTDAPSDAVGALVGRWRARANECRQWALPRSETYDICADELAAALGSRPVVDEAMDRARETSRRQAAVERLLADGYVWHDGRWISG